MGQVFTQVGVANAQIRQSVKVRTMAGEIIDHLDVIQAALDAASVELVGLATNDWGYESHSMENLRLDTRIPKITRDQAVGGLQVLTWKRMVGLHHPDANQPIVDPLHYKRAVSGDETLESSLIEVADEWYAMFRAHEEGQDHDATQHSQRETNILWRELNRLVYRRPELDELDFFQMMMVGTRLAVLAQQTQEYFAALLNRVPMPSTNPTVWYYENYLPYIDGGRSQAPT